MTCQQALFSTQPFQYQQARQQSLRSRFVSSPLQHRSFAGQKLMKHHVSNGVRCSAWFKFRQESNESGIYGSQGRDEYSSDDVEHYFNYMGMLATEGTYDRMDAMMATGMHPVDILLLMAASENDTPKVEELLGAGADPTVKDPKGKTPLELATKEEVKQLLSQKSAV